MLSEIDRDEEIRRRVAWGEIGREFRSLAEEAGSLIGRLEEQCEYMNKRGWVEIERKYGHPAPKWLRVHLCRHGLHHYPKQVRECIWCSPTAIRMDKEAP